MTRPCHRRRIARAPDITCFKPAGVPVRQLPEIPLQLDELESIRLADFLGLHQEDAAERMGVSRATFGRIVETARQKVARFLIEGGALMVKGGAISLSGARPFSCQRCQHRWDEPASGERPSACPACGGPDVRDSGRCGRGRCGGGRRNG